VPLPRGLPVVDHHCHLSPTGEGVAAARRFRRFGGTHLFLATQNYERTVPRSLDDYLRQFETTESLAHRVTTETGVAVCLVVAPYPVDLVHTMEAMGPGSALELHRAALDLAGKWVRDRRAVALGEVGRPHFPIAPEVASVVEQAFRYALEVAREVDCPAVVHSADLDATGYRELAERAAEAGIPALRVVKHYARRRLAATERSDVSPSYLARRELVRDVVRDPGPWFLETDYLDDPSRPGAVLDLATVPRRAAAVSEASEEAAELLWVPFVDSVERVYGFRPEVRASERV
jgi:TatD-related deoxyribonuclease